MQGVQLYIEVNDKDVGNSSRWGANAPDELVDILFINHSLAVGEESPRQNHTGKYQYVTMDLIITVLCAQKFQGQDCTQCVPGFTGLDCTDIDDCEEINCSGNGQLTQCMNETDCFSCNCSAGYTGILCEINIDDCIEVHCNGCLLYTSPSPRDATLSRMPSSA